MISIKEPTYEEQKLLAESLPTSVLIDEVYRRIEKYETIVDKLEAFCEGKIDVK